MLMINFCMVLFITVLIISNSSLSRRNTIINFKPYFLYFQAVFRMDDLR